MAKARVENREVEVKVVQTERAVVLEMSEHEAGVLLALFGAVGGSPDGPRGIIMRISSALYTATDRDKSVYFSTTHPVHP